MSKKFKNEKMRCMSKMLPCKCKWPHATIRVTLGILTGLSFLVISVAAGHGIAPIAYLAVVDGAANHQSWLLPTAVGSIALLLCSFLTGIMFRRGAYAAYLLVTMFAVAYCAVQSDFISVSILTALPHVLLATFYGIALFRSQNSGQALNQP
jgi:hypothetical protein